MKWVSVNNGTAKESFELWETDKKLAGISFSKHTRFARMVSTLGKRIFSFEKQGLFSQKEFIKNEYGVRIGKVEVTKPGAGKGIVEFDGKKYCYVYNQDNSGDLNLYDEAMKKNLLTCSFKAINTGLSKTKSLLDTKFASLLLVLCWYSFQPHNTAVRDSVM